MKDGATLKKPFQQPPGTLFSLVPGRAIQRQREAVAQLLVLSGGEG